MIEITQLGKSAKEIEVLEKVEGKIKYDNKMKYLFLNENRTVSDEKLIEFESKYQVNLPQEYVSFLKRHNGGEPNFNCIKNERVINYFFCMVSLDGDDSSIQWHLDIYKHRYPDAMLPIASAGGGDLILIGTSGEYVSKIYCWDHHFEAEKGGATYFDNITYIADNFNDFLEGIYDPDEV